MEMYNVLIIDQIKTSTSPPCIPSVIGLVDVGGGEGVRELGE